MATGMPTVSSLLAEYEARLDSAVADAVREGAGVTPGVHDTPATPADIAPTLAALVGAPFNASDGTALRWSRPA